MAEEEIKLEEWMIRQSKTFSKWCNMYLSKKGYEQTVGVGEEFGGSWKDGVTLMKLINALYDVDMPKRYKKDAKTRVHRLDNVTQALKMVDKAEVKTTNLKQVNLLDGEFKMMAGMVWNIILDYNIKGISVEDKNAKTGLLLWCQKKTKDYPGVMGDIKNFHKDWKNGNAFLALVDKHTTGKVNYQEMYDGGASAEEKMDAAWTECEKLGIPRLLECEDLTEVDIPDDKAVMTYVSEMFKVFSKEDIKDNAREHVSQYLSFQRRMDLKMTDYNERYDACMAWLQHKIKHFQEAQAPETELECRGASSDFKQYIVDEKPHKLSDVIEILDLLSDIQGELRANHRTAFVPDEDHQPSNLQDTVLALGSAENEYMNKIRGKREDLLEKVDIGGGVSDEKKAEFEKAFSVFDVDASGRLSKDEYKAALSGVGISLDDEEFEANWSSMSEDGTISKEQFMAYLEEFYSTSDTAESVLKSLQVIGNPDEFDESMCVGMSDEDKAYLMELSQRDGGLAAAIQGAFQE